MVNCTGCICSEVRNIMTKPISTNSLQAKVKIKFLLNTNIRANNSALSHGTWTVLIELTDIHLLHLISVHNVADNMHCNTINELTSKPNLYP
jgi:hypothetical protein